MNERVFTRHNLGGLLYIVVKGQFCAHRAPENVFKPNDLFGELEANFGTEPGGARYGYYINDVVAMEDDSEVLVIPTQLATKLLGPGPTLRAELFAKLREKMILRNARLTLRGAGEAPLYNEKVQWLEFNTPKRDSLLDEKGSRFFFPTNSGNPFERG